MKPKNNPSPIDSKEISFFVKKLSTGVKLPHDFDYKNEYR